MIPRPCFYNAAVMTNRKEKPHPDGSEWGILAA